MKFGKACQGGQPVDADIFRAVIGDIVADLHEFFNIFILLALGDSREFFLGIEAGASKSHKEADHQGVEAGLGKGKLLVVFQTDLV